MTESLKVLEENRKNKTIQEVEEDFKHIKEKKAQDLKADKSSPIKKQP